LAGAAVEADALAVLARDHPEAVVLDFVSHASPVGGRGALVGRHGGTKPGGRGMWAGAGDRRLLRSEGSEPSKLESLEVITCSPLGLGTGKNRDIAGAIIIEVLNAPFSGAVAVFDDGDILLIRVARQHVLESLSASKPLPLGGSLSG
jgi:hypothetical protein